ncbi:tetratricopeptide repeat protein [Thermoleptolyngbya oregonensis NK1-22]|uniref:Tetratricopeptide repeat protein n=1 Tax=Thermoleptolyngbya oregonensis NK1-22 TaxID=2547457 RepID=A0AA96Y6C1_9CYAN|nr:tetratricopeptide repeat protein [Thermoleptolyngbya oregonensis NK1-22]
MPTLAYWQGRTKEQAQLHTWLKDAAIPLVGVYGLGGFGKSTLAARVYEDSRQFVGKFWADLSQTLGFPDVARRALFAWGMPAEQVAEIEEIRLGAALVQQLGRGAYLLVLDNLESVLTQSDEWQSVTYRQFFELLLRTAGASKVLLTSRHRPPSLPARWLPLTEGLTPTEGAALLRQKGVLGRDEELQSVSQRVGGYPLSLVLIAGWLLAEEAADPQVRYLPDDLWALEGPYQGERQLSVEQVFGWSVGRLEERLRQMLWQISILRQPFDATTAAVVAEVDPPQAEADLRQLERRSLLQRPAGGHKGQQLFRWQPQVRELAQRQAGDQSAAHGRAVSHFAERVQPLQQMRGRENLRQAETDLLQDYLEVFHHLCELGLYGMALGWLTRETQPGERYSECDFWMQLSGYNDQREALYRRLVEEWRPQEEERRSYGYAQEKLADVLQFLDQREAAIALYDEAIATYQQVGDRLGYANALKAKADVLQFLDQREAAIALYDEAIATYQQVGDRLGYANALKAKADVLQFLDQREAAIALYDEAIATYQQVGDRLGYANALKAKADVLQFLDQREAAIALYDEAIATYQQVGARLGYANALQAKADVLQFLKQCDAAIALYDEAIATYQQVGDRLGYANALQAKADVLQFLDQREAAIALYDEAIATYQQVGARLGYANALKAKADVLQFLKQCDAAIALYDEAIATYQQVGARLGYANALKAKADVLQFLKQCDAAIALYDEAIATYQQVGDRLGYANALCSRASLLEDASAALEAFLQAQQIYIDINHPYSQARNLILYISSAQAALGQVEAAVESLQQAAEIGQAIGVDILVQVAQQRMAELRG